MLSIPSIIIASLLATGVVAPDPTRTVERPPPHKQHKEKLHFFPILTQGLHSRSYSDSGLTGSDLIYNPELLDARFGLARGSVEACLDDVLHGDSRLRLEVPQAAANADHVVLEDAPATCLGIVKEVVSRPDNADVPPEDMYISLIPGREDALRFNGFGLGQIEMIRHMAADGNAYGKDDMDYDVLLV